MRATSVRRSIMQLLVNELNVCSRTRNLDRGKQIHAQAMQTGELCCIYVATSLINMYAKCMAMADARQVFEGIKDPNVVSWNTLILGYAENGQGATALGLFLRMKSQGCPPDSFTYVAAIKACTCLSLKHDRSECLKRGRQIHSEIGCHCNIYVQSSLINMYAKCGSMVEARKVFDRLRHPNAVSWTALISGYAENGEGGTALELFSRMKLQGCAPNLVTIIAVLKSCASLALKRDASGKAECLKLGKQVHSELSCPLDIHVQSTLVDMYAKCGSMVEAHRVFDSIKHPNVVSWNALILGYAAAGGSETALDLFARMRARGCAPDSITLVAALKACASLGDLETGTRIHADMEMNYGAELNVMLVNSLVDFYAKCGSVLEAAEVFDAHPRTRTVVTWNVLLAGYGRLGAHMAVFGLYQQMQDAGFQPDAVTFLALLTCCAHAGLVEKANQVFETMSTSHGITPSLEHYTCMIDILGRSNKLDHAMALLQSMSCRPSAVTWMAVLCACRKWRNVDLGRLAFESLVTLEGSATPAAAYVLMAQIYGSRGMPEEQQLLELAMRNKVKSKALDDVAPA